MTRDGTTPSSFIARAPGVSEAILAVLIAMDGCGCHLHFCSPETL